MPRRHLQVLIPNTTLSEAYARGMMGVDLPGLQVPREKYESVRIVATDPRPELDAMLMVLEHPSYPETDDLAECPRVTLDDLPEVASEVPPPTPPAPSYPEEPVEETPTPTGPDTGGPAEVPTPPTPEPSDEPDEPNPDEVNTDEPEPDEPVLDEG